MEKDTVWISVPAGLADNPAVRSQRRGTDGGFCNVAVRASDRIRGICDCLLHDIGAQPVLHSDIAEAV